MAIQEHLVPESFSIERIPVREYPHEFVYGILAYLKDYLRIKSSDSLREATPMLKVTFNSSCP